MADVCPTGMIFIPCRGGISHAEDEFATWEAATQGAQVLLDTVTALANQL
jgi:N-carbamoyl-L-amino-acid hydrolase